MATESSGERRGEPFEEALAQLTDVHKKEVARLREQVETLERLIRNPGGGASNVKPSQLGRRFTLDGTPCARTREHVRPFELPLPREQGGIQKLVSAASATSMVSSSAESVETFAGVLEQAGGKQDTDEDIEKLDAAVDTGEDEDHVHPIRSGVASIEFVSIVPNVPDRDDTPKTLFTTVQKARLTPVPAQESNFEADMQRPSSVEPDVDQSTENHVPVIKHQLSRRRTLSRQMSKSCRQLQHASVWSCGTANPGWVNTLEEKAVPYQWQWEHRTGWRDYDKHENVRIEHAYQRGDSKVRLKTGKHGVTPMEIYFVDMIQFDPISRNTRNVKREGHQGVWMKLQRYVNEVLRQIETGRPRRESFVLYQRRRQAIQEGTTGSKQNISFCDGDRTICGSWCADIARSPWFFAASMLAVLLNALWIGLEADVNAADSLLDASLGVQVAEYLSCFVFCIELTIRFFAFVKKRDCLKDAWFRFDFTLVVLMLVEIVIMPPILKAVGRSGRETPLFLAPLLRLVRLAQLTRLARLLRAFPEALTLIRGILAAMRSVCVTLTLLLGLLFVFGVIFRTQSDSLPESREQFFPSLVASMWTLLIRGVFLDTPSTVLDPMRSEGGVVLSLAFIFFIFLSCLTLLNMLIGLFCQVASQVSQKEKDLAEQAYLQTHLLEIMDCYDKDNDQSMSLDEFELFMENPDVHEVLKKFGVDPTGIYSLTDVLYNDFSSALSFSDLLEVIMRLRGGSTAHVTDIVELREYMKRRFDRFEEAINPGSIGNASHMIRTLA